MPRWIHLGKEVLSSVRIAQCCQNCKHCISRTPCDDPTEYACARLSKPKKEPPMVFGIGSPSYHAKCAKVHLWWAMHYVAAGTVCDHFMLSPIPPTIKQYEDDLTREQEKGT